MISDFERRQRRERAEVVCAAGYTWSYSTRGYQVFLRGEFISGAGIAKSARGPSGRAARNQLDDYYYSALLTAERHMEENSTTVP